MLLCDVQRRKKNHFYDGVDVSTPLVSATTSYQLAARQMITC